MRNINSSVILQKVKLSARAYFDEFALSCMSLDLAHDLFANHLAASLAALVLGEKVQEHKKTVTFEYPANPWEHLKTYLPKWARRILPVVKYRTVERTVTFEQIQCFPKIKTILPPEELQYEFSSCSVSVSEDNSPLSQ